MNVNVPKGQIDYYDMGVRSIDNEKPYIRYGYIASEQVYTEAIQQAFKEQGLYNLLKVSQLATFSNLAWLHKYTNLMPTILYLRLCKGLNEQMQTIQDGVQDNIDNIFSEIKDPEQSISKSDLPDYIKETFNIINFARESFFLREYVTQGMEYDDDNDKFVYDAEKTKKYFIDVISSQKKNMAFFEYLSLQGNIKAGTDTHIMNLYKHFIEGNIENLTQYATNELTTVKKNPIVEHFKQLGFEEIESKTITDMIELPGFTLSTNLYTLDDRESRYAYASKKTPELFRINDINDKEYFPVVIVLNEWKLLTEARLLCILAKVSYKIPQKEKTVDSEFVKLVTDTYKQYFTLKDKAFETYEPEDTKAYVDFCKDIITKLPTSYDYDKKEFIYEPYTPKIIDKTEIYEKNNKAMDLILTDNKARQKLSKIDDFEKYGKTLDKLIAKKEKQLQKMEKKQKQMEEQELDER